MTSEFDIPQGAVSRLKALIEAIPKVKPEDREPLAKLAVEGAEAIGRYLDGFHDLFHDIANGKAPKGRGAVGTTPILQSDHVPSIYGRTKFGLDLIERWEEDAKKVMEK